VLASVAEVDYIGSVGRHLYALYDLNRFAGDKIQHGGNFTGLAPGFGAINYAQSSESSGYNGLHCLRKTARQPRRDLQCCIHLFESD
jgi:hypothetical protein